MINSETQIGWQDYLAIIVRRRSFFLVPCAAIIGLTMLIGLILPKYYRAETTLMVEDQKTINPLMQGMAVSKPTAERMRTLREELLSWTSLTRLAHDLKMDQRVGSSPVALERLIKRLQKEIEVKMRGPELVIVAYEDRSPKVAQEFVNSITTIYMDRNVESQSAEAESAISFIESEMVVYKKKLEDAERALRDFKELYVMQMPVATELNTQIIDLEVLHAQLMVENTDDHPTVKETTRRITELKRKRNDEIKRVIANAMATGQDVSFYQDLVTALQSADAGKESIPADPRIRTAKEAYQGWVERLDSMATAPSAQASPQQVQVIAGGADGKGLEFIGPTSATISLGPREEQELARLSRDYDVHSRTYTEMQQRLERAKITQRLGESDEGTKFKVLEPARLPLRPVRPDLLKMFIFSLFIGIFVGAGAAFVAEYLDQSFQTAEDLQAAMALPVIGSISTIVTEADLDAKRKRRKGWVSFKPNLARLKTYIINPIWARVDRVMVRWGL